MPRFRFLMLAFLIACAAPAAFAQQALEQQMTADEFRAAGLDKLSPDELASLNRWLQRQVEQETTVAVEQVREQARVEARQEAQAGAAAAATPAPVRQRREAFTSSIEGEFTGFGSRQRYRLANGQVWEQTDGARLDGVRLSNPRVTLTPGVFGSWQMQVEGYNTRAKVKPVN